MKIGGKELGAPKNRTLVLPRSDDPDDDVVIIAAPVLDWDLFEKTVQEPKPPVMTQRGKGPVQDLDNPSFKVALEQFNKKRLAYMIIQSLKATPGIEWVSVDEDDSDTWPNYEADLKSCFTLLEVRRIQNLVFEANAINDDRIEEARQRFLQRQGAEELEK